MGKRISILGAGSWGMALAHLLDGGGHSVLLWEFDDRDFDLLSRERGNPARLADFRLPESIKLTNDLREAARFARHLVVAVPSQAVRSVMSALRGAVDHLEGITNVSKGIEIGSLMRMSEVIVEGTETPADKVATLSGPSHAEEVILDMPTTVVVASAAESFAQECQRLFSVGNFRVYVNTDLIGVELGGSLKNIIAIATGIADGLNMGDNTRGALLTRGLAEMTRLGSAMRARADTFAGLAGIGDLVTTSSSRHSRNRMVGERVGRGEKLQDVLSEMTMVAEGVETTRSGYSLAQLHAVEMPITCEVHNVLFDGKPPREAVVDLLGRKLKAEIWQ
ncbi:MAG: NAD(P)-dependent glycerol-3-phosphate dehydrogenase [Candidatus Zixiibacteriota bacterium]|nr:MAG: NAD(P)-dependent glycerol-3-phosphate dehydrogenase [candidate division Zixibacteria bacterium]